MNYMVRISGTSEILTIFFCPSVLIDTIKEFFPEK